MIQNIESRLGLIDAVMNRIQGIDSRITQLELAFGRLQYTLNRAASAIATGTMQPIAAPPPLSA